MAKKKIVEEVKQDTTPEAAPEPKVSNKKNATEALVMNKGRLVRVYSLADHGEDFAALAQEFSSDREGHEVVLK
jgi:hypothetical protein